MAQHDFVIDNADGLTVRTDLQAAIQALATQSGGTVEPTTKYPGQVWLDTSAGGDGVLRVRNQANSAWLAFGELATVTALKGHIYGLTLSNNGTDATNDIDIAVGEAATNDSDPRLMKLASALTKRLDASWAVGSGNGGLDTGSIANTTYHVWLIQRSDTGVVDVLFSTSASSPTMPANYDRKRRIGSIIRESGAIVAFTQLGDIFQRTFVTDRDNTAANAGANLTLSVPAGIVCIPLLRVFLNVGSSTNCTVGLGHGGSGATIGVFATAVTGSGDDQDRVMVFVPALLFTNTSRQVYFQQTNTAGTPSASQVSTYGWVDRRGQDGGL